MAATPSLRRNLALDATTAFGWGAGVGVVNGLLPSMARLGGADAIALAALGAAPFIANVSTLGAGYLGGHDPRRAAFTRALGCSMLMLAALVPSGWLIVLVVAFWMGGSLTTPVTHHVWGAIYPARSRARFVSFVRTAQALASALAAIVGGFVADRLGGTPVVVAAGAVSAGCGVAYAGIRVPARTEARRFSGVDSLRTVLGNPVMRWVTIGQLVWGAGLFAAQPLYPLIQIDRLHLSLAEVGTLALVTSVATLASYLAWGVLCDRSGGIPVLLVGCVLGLLAPLMYALAGDVSLLWWASACTGLANAAIDIGYTSVQAERIPQAARASSAAGWSALMGIRGMIVPFAAGALVQARVFSPTAMLLVCTAAAVVSLLAYLPAFRAYRATPRVREGAPAPAPVSPEPPASPARPRPSMTGRASQAAPR